MMSSHNDSFTASGNSPTNSGKISADFVVENHGSIFFLKPRTPAAISWVEEHIADNGYQPYYPTVVVEHRFIADIVAGIQNDGLVVV
jgi:hypothetical protein